MRVKCECEFEIKDLLKENSMTEILDALYAAANGKQEKEMKDWARRGWPCDCEKEEGK